MLCSSWKTRFKKVLFVTLDWMPSTETKTYSDVLEQTTFFKSP